METLDKKSEEQKKAGEYEVKIADRLFLISNIINNFISEEDFLILAGLLNLTGVFLVNKAAYLEAEEQQVAPGVTTFANNLKIIGSTLSIVVSLILFSALLIEISLRRQGVTFSPTATGTTGAFQF